MTRAPYETAIVLSGGGARAAYQIGVLRAIAQMRSRGSAMTFRVVSGTSAGAINAALLATNADDFRRGVAQLLQLWRNIEVGDVYKADLGTVSAHGMRWLASVLIGSRGPARTASMFDTSPLRTRLRREFDPDRVATHVAAGRLHALAINATSYTSGQSVTFFQGESTIAPWGRIRRRGERATISVDHLLASSAIPFIFPAARVGDDYYADGSVRQIAPLSPALHLGARRLLVIAVGQFIGQQRPPGDAHRTPHYPSFAQVAGHALSSIFLDNLGADLERMQRLNRVFDLLPPSVQHAHPEIFHVDTLVIGPTRDLGQLAIPYASRLPTGVRYLLRGLGATEGTGANLLSYLMFDHKYCRELLALGYADALARRDEIEAFLAGDTAGYLPFFPKDLLS
jgi:NTE family protein